MRYLWSAAAATLEVVALGTERMPDSVLYTDESTASFPVNMSFLRSRRVTQRTIFRILIGGFTLVLFLLLLANVVSVKNTRSIQAGASRLVSEQILTSHLINEIQAEQATLNAIVYKLSSGPESLNSASVLTQLEDTDEALARMVADAAGTPEQDRWRELNSATHDFSFDARRLIANQDDSPESLEKLMAKHQQVVRLIDKLVRASSAKIRALEKEIERRSEELLNESVLLLGSCLLLAFICAVLTIRTTASMFAQMQWQAGELSRVSWHMLEGQEATARRFSHELHDELGQSLTAVKANLMALSPGNMQARRTDCVHLVDEAISNVRELSQLLRPVILDDFGLDASLRWLAERFTYRTNTQVEYDSTLSDRLSDDTETQLFRIAQEALTNVARHSGATRVRIELKQEGGRIRLVCSDNGRGLADSKQNGTSGLGMVGMRARARHAGGELTVRSAPSQGVTIDVWVPATKIKDDDEQDPDTAGR